MTPPAGDRWFRVQEMVVDLYGAEMGPEAAWIYTCLARYASWDTGECWPSHPTLRAVSGMALPRVRKALTRLEDLGLIAAERRRMAVGGVVRWRKVYTLLDPSPLAVMERRRARQTPLAPHHGHMGKPRPPRRSAQPEVSSDTAHVFREQIVQGTESAPEPFGEQFVPDSGNNLCPKQDLRERDANPDPDPRARNAYPPARGQSGTSPVILPDAPNSEDDRSVGRPPAPPPLAVGAAEGQATESAEEGKPPVMQEEAVALHECGWPFTALVVEKGRPPAPEQPTVSVCLPCTEAAPCSGAPAEPLAAPPGGVARATRAVGARARAAPPPGEWRGAHPPASPLGRHYVAAWSDGPPEVGRVLDERGSRFLSPGFVASLTTRYGQEFIHA